MMSEQYLQAAQSLNWWLASCESVATSVYNVSPVVPVYLHNRAAFPAFDVSASVEFTSKKIAACFMKLLKTNVLKNKSFPVLNAR